jgi:hypothetical protein
MQISVFNTQGHLVQKLENSFYEKGVYNLNHNVSALKPGFYYIRFILGTEEQSYKLLKQ